MKWSIVDLQIKAKYLGFTCSIITTSRYMVKNSGKGYQGSIESCMAYLQGWEERAIT